MTETQEQLRTERGNRYGKFGVQVEAVASIVKAMSRVYVNKNGVLPPYTLLAEWHYLALKLTRIPASPDYKDNYDDLSLYSMLISENNNAS